MCSGCIYSSRCLNGNPSTARNIQLRRSFINADVYSFALLSNEFQRIDLSSLEEISYGGVVWSSNRNLCYVGDLGLYVNRETLNNTGVFFAECSAPSRRKDNDTCSEYYLMFVCSHTRGKSCISFSLKCTGHKILPCAAHFIIILPCAAHFIIIFDLASGFSMHTRKISYSIVARKEVVISSLDISVASRISL